MTRQAITGYLKSRRLVLLLLVAQSILLAGVWLLYGLPAVTVQYALLLLLGVQAFFGACDIIGYCRGVRQLRSVIAQASTMLERLPEAQDLHSQLINQALETLEQRCRRAELTAQQQREATAQYYTLWSHQTKTPLAAMRLLLQESVPERGLLEQELFKVEQYVDMALQYQRLGGAPTDLVLREYPLEPLVKQSVRELSSLFINKKIGIELGELGGSVLTDKKWLLFVLEQLLSNAVKYTPSGGKVTVWQQAGDLLLRDNGIGIAPEDLPRICEWGYTGYNGHESMRSTGVGLSLCKRTLQMLGHSMEIASTVGEGTTIRLTLTRPILEQE